MTSNKIPQNPCVVDVQGNCARADIRGVRLNIGDKVAFAVGDNVLPQLSTAKIAIGFIIGFEEFDGFGKSIVLIEYRYTKYSYSEDDFANPIVETQHTTTCRAEFNSILRI